MYMAGKMIQANLVFWLATWAGKMGLSCSLGISYFGAVRTFSGPYNDSFIGQAY